MCVCSAAVGMYVYFNVFFQFWNPVEINEGSIFLTVHLFKFT